MRGSSGHGGEGTVAPTKALSLPEAVEALRSPFAIEDAAGMAVVVDVASDPGNHLDAAAAEVLRVLPAVAIAVGDDPAFDVCVDDEGAAEEVVVAVERSPSAAVTLVQLLRATEALDVAAALVCESLAYSTLQAGPGFAAWQAGRDTAEPSPTGTAPTRTTPAHEPPVLVERGDSTATITLNRPEVRNAIDTVMRDAMVEALRATDGLEVVLRGAGPSFCSGGDLREFGTLPDPATAHLTRTTRSPAWWMAHTSERLTARVHGPCVGAGVELPAFARRVIATPDASFQLPEVGFGLVPGAGGTVSLPRRIGRRRTAWLALTGQRLDAATAHTWGLVDEVDEA